MLVKGATGHEPYTSASGIPLHSKLQQELFVHNVNGY